MPVAAMAVMHRQRSLVLQGLLQWQHCLQEDLNESLKPMFDNYNICNCNRRSCFASNSSMRASCVSDPFLQKEAESMSN